MTVCAGARVCGQWLHSQVWRFSSLCICIEDTVWVPAAGGPGCDMASTSIQLMKIYHSTNIKHKSNYYSNMHLRLYRN